MEPLQIFMMHVCPAFGAVIALLMFASPLQAVLASNRNKDIGVRSRRGRHGQGGKGGRNSLCQCWSCQPICGVDRWSR